LALSLHDALPISRVGTVTKTELIHLGHHRLGPFCPLNLSLREQSQLAHFCRNKEHGRSVLAGCHAGPATDTCSSIHRLVGNMFWNGYSITVGNTACVYRDITSSLDNLVE